MNSQFRFFTDTATLAVFDPERLKHRADAESDWWCLDFLQLEEIRSGSVALVALGGDGAYRVRIESTTRRVGPEPGMIFTTKVSRSESSEVCLKECGPCSYHASPVDYSGVAWKDTIQFAVPGVDHDAKQIVGEFVGKVKSQ
jgi:hypothetical protein